MGATPPGLASRKMKRKKKELSTSVHLCFLVVDKVWASASQSCYCPFSTMDCMPSDCEPKPTSLSWFCEAFCHSKEKVTNVSVFLYQELCKCRHPSSYQEIALIPPPPNPLPPWMAVSVPLTLSMVPGLLELAASYSISREMVIGVKGHWFILDLGLCCFWSPWRCDGVAA